MYVDNPDQEKKEFEVTCKERKKVLENKMNYQNKLKGLADELEKLQKQGDSLRKKISPILKEIHLIQEYR